MNETIIRSKVINAMIKGEGDLSEKMISSIANELEPYTRLRILESNVLNWGDDRGILKNSTAQQQFMKTVEEMGELASALSKNDLDKISDGIGDVLVTLILVAKLTGIDLTHCLSMAWFEIKYRKGYLNSQGVFVKDESA